MHTLIWIAAGLATYTILRIFADKGKPIELMYAVIMLAICIAAGYYGLIIGITIFAFCKVVNWPGWKKAIWKRKINWL